MSHIFDCNVPVGMGPKMGQLTPDILRRIAKRCGLSAAAFDRSLAGHRLKNCITWRGACIGKTPMIRVEKSMMSVRSLIAGPYARPTCGNPRCVNRAHILTPLERALSTQGLVGSTTLDVEDEDIRDIQELHADGYSIPAIVEIYGADIVNQALSDRRRESD